MLLFKLIVPTNLRMHPEPDGCSGVKALKYISVISHPWGWFSSLPKHLLKHCNMSNTPTLSWRKSNRHSSINPWSELLYSLTVTGGAPVAWSFSAWTVKAYMSICSSSKSPTTVITPLSASIANSSEIKYGYNYLITVATSVRLWGSCTFSQLKKQ